MIRTLLIDNADSSTSNLFHLLAEGNGPGPGYYSEATQVPLKKQITTLRPLRELLGEIDGHGLVFPPEVPPIAAALINSVENLGPGPEH